MSFANITLDDFTPHVGKKFPVNLALPQPLELELRSAEPGRRPPKPGSRQSFALIFRAAPQWNCTQTTYPIMHPTLGELPVFLVPIGRGPEGTELEAVFNFV
ncbi:MAG TPA: hypothetical protein VG710_08350 [Opitutus sp.]|nr:hypothetical protein [Opitutus sp.]